MNSLRVIYQITIRIIALTMANKMRRRLRALWIFRVTGSVDLT